AETPTASAVRSLVQAGPSAPSSTFRRIWACWRRCAAALPLRRTSSNSWRSSAESRTTYLILRLPQRVRVVPDVVMTAPPCLESDRPGRHHDRPPSTLKDQFGTTTSLFFRIGRVSLHKASDWVGRRELSRRRWGADHVRP